MTEIVEIAKKYGSTGVLACWLWFTNSRVESLEDKLIDCYRGQASIEQLDFSNRTNNDNPILAILPEVIKIKREDA